MLINNNNNSVESCNLQNQKNVDTNIHIFEKKSKTLTLNITDEKIGTDCNSGQQLQSTEIRNVDAKSSEIKNSAIALLARREHSRQELQIKLSRRYSDVHEIEKQLDLLAKADIQSEERFVEAYVRLKKNHGKGPNYIKQELKRRGVSNFLVAAYVYEKDDDWFELASTVYEKKFGATQITDNKEKARRIRFMVSRGFTPDSVFPILNSCTEVD